MSGHWTSGGFVPLSPVICQSGLNGRNRLYTDFTNIYTDLHGFRLFSSVTVCNQSGLNKRVF